MITGSAFPDSDGGLPPDGSGIDVPDVPDLCVPYLDVFPWASGWTATLDIVLLPASIDDRGLANKQQTKTIDNTTGRFLFDAVPQGARICIICEPAGINATYAVPATESFAIATATPL